MLHTTSNKFQGQIKVFKDYDLFNKSAVFNLLLNTLPSKTLSGVTGPNKGPHVQWGINTLLAAETNTGISRWNWSDRRFLPSDICSKGKRQISIKDKGIRKALLTKELVKRHLPKCFFKCPRTRVIIDCTELKVEKPSAPSSQKVTWSHYKSHNTFKLLVGITPSGAFSSSLTSVLELNGRPLVQNE